METDQLTDGQLEKPDAGKRGYQAGEALRKSFLKEMGDAMKTQCLTIRELFDMTDNTMGDVDECAANLERWMDCVDEFDVSDAEKDHVSKVCGALIFAIDRWNQLRDGFEKVAG